MKQVEEVKEHTWKDYLISFGSYFVVLGFAGYMLGSRIYYAVFNIQNFKFIAPSQVLGVALWLIVFIFLFSVMFVRKPIEDKLTNIVSKRL